MGTIPYLLIIILIFGSCQTTPQPILLQNPALSSTPTPTHTSTPLVETATTTPTPSPTNTTIPTPIPTYEPSQLLSMAKTGLSQIVTATAGKQLICLRYEDLNADGLAEWFALTHQNDTLPNLQAVILDENTNYILEPAQPKPGIPDVGLGQFPVCDIALKDINLDGKTEIAIFGHTQDNETLLHLFAWDAANHQYERLGYFSGDAGVKIVETDGDLALEIWEGYRVHEAPALSWYVIHTWQDQAYGWTTDRYDWYSQERPYAYPTHRSDFAVISYYLALNDRDLPGAYDLLMPQARTNYDTWASGYATTMRLDVGGVHIVPSDASPGRALIAAMVSSYDNEGGTVIKRLWNIEWDTALTEQGWRLLASKAEKLEESKATYFP